MYEILIKTRDKLIMDNKKEIELLIPYARKAPTSEAIKAEAMFRKFMAGDFSYDELSDHPDYPVYASSQVLVRILPLIIDEMFRRSDTGNFLIYHVLTAIDPFGEGKAWVAERATEVIEAVDKKTAEKIFNLLLVIKTDPPVPIERIDRLIELWDRKTSTLA